MSTKTTIEMVETLFRPLSESEKTRAQALIPVIEDSLKSEAKKVGKNIDSMITMGTLPKNVFISVVVDVCARTIMTSTTSEPMTQFAQSGMGYSASGSFLNPGGGLFIKNSELARLGLKRQRMGVIDFYDCNANNDTWH